MSKKNVKKSPVKSTSASELRMLYAELHGFFLGMGVSEDIALSIVTESWRDQGVQVAIKIKDRRSAMRLFKKITLALMEVEDYDLTFNENPAFLDFTVQRFTPLT